MPMDGEVSRRSAADAGDAPKMPRRDFLLRAARGAAAGALLAGGFLLHLRRSANRPAFPEDRRRSADGACSRCPMARACPRPAAPSYRIGAAREPPTP